MFSFAVRFCGVAVVFFSLLVIILLVILNRRLGIGYMEDITTLSRLQEKFPSIFLTTAIIQAVVASFVLFILSLFWAHAVAGPLVRFRRDLSKLKEGEFSGKVSFREKDQLHPLAQALSNVQNVLQGRREQFDCRLKQADRLLEEYAYWREQGGDNQLQCEDRLKELKNVYGDMDQLFSKEDNY